MVNTKVLWYSLQTGVHWSLSFAILVSLFVCASNMHQRGVCVCLNVYAQIEHWMSNHSNIIENQTNKCYTPVRMNGVCVCVCMQWFNAKRKKIAETNELYYAWGRVVGSEREKEIKRMDKYTQIIIIKREVHHPSKITDEIAAPLSNITNVTTLTISRYMELFKSALLLSSRSLVAMSIANRAGFYYIFHWYLFENEILYRNCERKLILWPSPHVFDIWYILIRR